MAAVWQAPPAVCLALLVYSMPTATALTAQMNSTAKYGWRRALTAQMNSTANHGWRQAAAAACSDGD
eukprot:9026040-Pyramimonas_sp.AAC.1